MLNKTPYTLRCTGCIDSRWVAGFLTLFKASAINIRRLVMVVLPDAKPVDGVVPSRLEVAFELCEEENPSFLAAVDSHLETLPQAAKKILQNA